MKLLKRKVDKFLIDWKNSPDKKPLIIKGARQIGKTESIKNFAKNNYKSVIEINFVLQKQYKDIFDNDMFFIMVSTSNPLSKISLYCFCNTKFISITLL